MRILVTAAMVAVLCLALLTSWQPASADEGWVIDRFDVQISVESSGRLRIQESLAVDFRGLEKHGIFRDIPVVYRYDDSHDRVYDLAVQSVTDGSGRRWPYTTSREGSFYRVKIGDPDITVSGKQSYIIVYTVDGALNGFADHDELYWNATGGNWPVAIESANVTIELPRDGIRQIACYQGRTGSTEACAGSNGPRIARFGTTRTLPEGEQITVVVGFDKGIVTEPAPRLERRARDFTQWFDITPATTAGAVLALVGTTAVLGRLWWVQGRDRRFITMHYLTGDSREETAPVFSRDPVVVEYTPPEQLRPAQMGLLLDERADTLDVTAAIIDLAVRGHVRIEEVEHSTLGIFKSKDWRFIQLENPADAVQPYEQELLSGLFQNGSPALLSELKNKFHSYLERAQDRLYEDARRQKFFPSRPDRVRLWWTVAGLLVTLAGAGLVVLLGAAAGAGLAVLPVVAGGLALMALAQSMPRRTALGREMLRRVLGFRDYVATAETGRQRYNEQANVFATYLPYAMVFRCVDQWARKLESLGGKEEDVQGWYAGTAPFHAAGFSRDMRSFSSDVSSVIVSTPGGSGGSGFSGGSAGGGGGGGGGGSW